MRLYHVFLAVSLVLILVSVALIPIGVVKDNPIYVHIDISDERIVGNKLVLVIRVIIVNNLDELFRLESLEPMAIRIINVEGHVIYEQNRSVPPLTIHPGNNTIAETQIEVDVGNTSKITIEIYSGRYKLLSVDGKTKYEVSEDLSYLLEVGTMGIAGVNKEQNRVIIASINTSTINTREAKIIPLEVEVLNNNEKPLVYSGLDGGGGDTASILLQIIVIAMTLYVADKLVRIFFD